MNLRTNDHEIKESLEKFSQGDSSVLFELAINSLFDSYQLLKDPHFVLNCLSQFEKEGRSGFIVNMAINNRLDFSVSFNLDESAHKKIIEQYWGTELPNNIPLLLAAVPFLQDEEIANIINHSNFYKNENKQELANLLVLTFFKKNNPKSLEALSQEYFILNELKRYEQNYKIVRDGKEDLLSLEEFLFEEILDKPNLITTYANLFYGSVGHYSEQWLLKKLDEPKIDYKMIKSFIDINFDSFLEEAKEDIIATTLHNTKDTELLMYVLGKIGVSNIKDYKPKTNPIWTKAHNHKNDYIFRKLLKSGVDLFDYHQISSRTFASCLAEGSSRQSILDKLEHNKISKEQFLSKLFDKKTIGEDTTNNFAITVNSGESIFNDLLNFLPEDISHLDKRFNRKKFESLLFADKLSLLSELAEKTFLSPVYIHKHAYNRESLKQREISFNSWLNNEYSLDSDYPKNYIIEEHLSLLSAISPTDYDGKFDYRSTYFKIANKMFESYSVRSISEKSGIYKTLQNVVDYVATNPNLPWKDLGERIDNKYSKKELSEGGKNLLNYLSKICLSYSISNIKSEEKKKFKI